MNYKEAIEGKNVNDIGENLTYNIKKWENAGDFILGRLLKVEDFQGSKFSTNCKSYLFDTDEGKVSTILGASSDKQLSGKDIIGSVLYVEYKGQIDLEGGKRCNHFMIVDVTKNYAIDKSISPKASHGK